MRETRSSGSVRGASGDGRPYRERVSPVPPRPREGPFTKPTAGAQPWPRERVLMPHGGHSTPRRSPSIEWKTHPCPSPLPAVGPAPLARNFANGPRKPGSHQTPRWREPDSNHRSRCCKRLRWALPIGTSARSVEPPKVRSEIARIDLGTPPMAVPFAAGPMVRIRFPPPVSRLANLTAYCRGLHPACAFRAKVITDPGGT